MSLSNHITVLGLSDFYGHMTDVDQSDSTFMGVAYYGYGFGHDHKHYLISRYLCTYLIKPLVIH